MSNADNDRTDRTDDDVETARDVLSVFNADSTIDDPGRPRDLDPGESLPTDADVPPPQ